MNYHEDEWFDNQWTGRCYSIGNANPGYIFNAVSREPTVGLLGCVLEGRHLALVLEGRQSTVHYRKRLPTAGGMMGWQYENPS